MFYRELGKTGEKVSILGFGCMRFPTLDKNPDMIDEAKALPMLRKAIDRGVNYIDTAYPYHGTGLNQPGASEPFVGRALRDGYRRKVHLATKLPVWLVQERKDMDRLLDEQLKRLETDVIDFYLLHSLDINRWKKLEAMGVTEFLDSAIEDGRIRYAGFSFHDSLQNFIPVADGYDWSFCQIQYNFLDEAFEAGKGGLQYAAAKGMGIVVMEPLRGGSLAQCPEEACNLYKSYGINRTPAEWALRWIWNHPEVSTVLSGMTEMSQLEENMKSAGKTTASSMSPRELEIVRKVAVIYKERIPVGCTACRYCMPCEYGVNIPICLQIYIDYHMFNDEISQSRNKWRYSLVLSPEARASACTNCGKCKERCPQHIDIPRELEKVKAAFGS